MKTFILFLFAMSIQAWCIAQSVGIGTTNPNASAALEVSSTTQGMLVPRMTTAQRALITSPATGLLVFDMTTNSFWFKGSGQWIELVDTANTVVHRMGTNIYMGMNGNVGLGTLTPSTKLEVRTAPASPGITHTDGTVTLQTSTTAGSGILKTTTNHSLQLNSNNGTNQFTILPSGFIGIGTAAPTAMVEVVRGSASDGTMALRGTTYNSYFNKSTTENTFVNGGKAGSLLILNGDPALGNVGIGTNTPSQKFHVVGNTYLQGNVGIGMATPVFPLHFPETTGNKIALYGNSGPNFGFGVAANLMQIYTPSAAAAIGFGVGSSTSFTENMRLTGDGKLGIGTTTPTEKLSVTGNSTISGGLTLGGGLGVGLGVAVGGGLAVAGGVGIGGAMGVGISTPAPSAQLDISSTTKGFLMPRMTTAQRDAIPSPAEGLTVYNTETHSPWYRTDDDWEEVKPDSSASDEKFVFRNGQDSIYMGLTDNVGVGTTSPHHKFQVVTANNNYGLSHSNGTVDIATWASSTTGGWIGTVSNHPFNLFANDGTNQFVLTPQGNIGIGTGTPHAALQFSNAQNSRKIVLKETNNNSYNFAGFGVNGNSIRYQVPDTSASHSFNSGTLFSQDTNKLLMRIHGNGKVGIGVETAFNRLDIHNGPNQQRTGTHPSNLAMYVTGTMLDAGNGVEFRNFDATEGIGFGKNTIYAAGSNTNQDLNIAAKGASGNFKLITNGLDRIFVNGSGNIGIGTVNPNAALQFANTLTKRKIVLWEDGNNDHQFYGLGIDGLSFRYQVSGPSASHIFYAGTSTTTSKELVRITGEGRVGIGNDFPLASIEVARGTGPLGTAVFRGTSHWSHFNYGTNEDTYIRGGKDSANIYLNDGASMGNVLIGPGFPIEKFTVNGNSYVTGNVGIGVLSQNKLDIQAGSSRIGTHPSGRPLYVTGDIGAEDQGIEFRHANGTQGIGFGYNTMYAAGSAADQDLGIAAKGTGNLLFKTNGTEKMRVASNGNVAIGTDDAFEKLTVEGNAYVSGSVIVGYGVSSNTVNIPPGATLVANCDCANGKKVLGGGWNGQSLDVTSSAPTGGGAGWSSTAHNFDPINSHAITVYAICARLAP